MAAKIDPQSLLTELADGVIVCTKEGEILFANPAFAQILGYPLEKIKKMNLSKDLVERQLEWKAMVSLLEQGSLVQDYEIKFKKGDTSAAVASISASNLRDNQGAFIGIAVVLRDITTRKGVEYELRDKAFRIDVMNKIAKVAASETDLRMRALVNICGELKKLVNFDLLSVGITEENGRHVEVMVPSPDDPSSAKSLGMVLLEGSLVEKLRFSRSPMISGKEVWRKPFSELSVIDVSRYESLLAVPLVSRGRVVGTLNLFHSKPNEYNLDTADLLQMVADQVAGLVDNMVLLDSLEKRIRVQETLVRAGVGLQKAISTQQIYAAIASSIKEVVFYTDLSFYMIDWSKRLVVPVYAVGGYTDETLANPGTLDEGVVGVVAKTGKAEFMDDVDADPRSAEIPGVPPEHSAMLAIPLLSPEGVLGVLELYRPRGHVFTTGDLETGKLFAQQASVALINSNTLSNLQDVKKEIEMLNDLMFHDINNYNFATLNYVQMIANSKDVPAEHRMYLEKSIHLIRQTADLIENVKKLTKIGGMSSQDFVRVDLSDVLRKVVSGIEASFPERSLSVNMKIPESSAIMGNKLIEELFVNLLSNSVKYDPHDEVEVDLTCEAAVENGNSFWRVCIMDRGNGIPDEKKHLLFQKYVRLKQDSKIEGTGLGLSICRALTDKFGGRIWVEDRVPGKSELGAKFCVMLPAAKAQYT